MSNPENKETQKGQQMDKLSERMRQHGADSLVRLAYPSVVRKWADEVAQLEAKLERINGRIPSLREALNKDDYQTVGNGLYWIGEQSRKALETGGE